MVVQKLFVLVLAIALPLAIPSPSEAGLPLICHPFEAGGAAVLPWGDGSSWNSPDRSYDVQRLTDDTLRLLSRGTPVLARMENLRRATIYASRDPRVADALLAEVMARVGTSPTPDAQALFDAGYLIESFKQMAHIFRLPAPTRDGYAMVRRAIAIGGANGEMEFAASLMTSGAAAAEHRRRAQAGASAGSLLARNLESIER